MTVAAVVLAASPASALADADGTPGIRRIADTAWAGGATPVVVCSFDPDGGVAAALANAEVDARRAGGSRARARSARSSTAIEAARPARRRDRRRPRLAGPPGLGRRGDRHPAHRRPTARTAPPSSGPAYRRRGRLPGAAPGRAPRGVRRPGRRTGCPASCSTTSRRRASRSRSSRRATRAPPTTSRSPRADLPPYEGPPVPADAHEHEWGAAAADVPDEEPPTGPAPVRIAAQRLGAARCAARNARIVGLLLDRRWSSRSSWPWAWWLQPRSRCSRRPRRRWRPPRRWRSATPASGSSGAPAAGDGDDRAHRLSRREGPGPRRTGRSRRRSPAQGYLVRDRGHAAQPRDPRRRPGGRRDRRASRDRGTGRSAATRWAARWPRSTSADHPGAVAGARVLGVLRGDGPLGAATSPCSRPGARSTPGRRGCRAPEARAAVAAGRRRSSRSRAATTSRWAGTRASPTTRRRRSRARTSRRSVAASTVELLARAGGGSLEPAPDPARRHRRLPAAAAPTRWRAPARRSRAPPRASCAGDGSSPSSTVASSSGRHRLDEQQERRDDRRQARQRRLDREVADRLGQDAECEEVGERRQGRVRSRSPAAVPNTTAHAAVTAVAMATGPAGRLSGLARRITSR